MSQPPKAKYSVGDHVELLPYNRPEFREGHITQVRIGVFDCYYMVKRLDGHEVELDDTEIAPWPETLIQRLKNEAGRLRTSTDTGGRDHLAALLEEAAEALRPKSLEENLEECRKWRMSDEEAERLLH